MITCAAASTTSSRRRRPVLTACLSIALALPAAAGAQSVASASGERLTLEAAIRLAVENNRQLQSARLQIEKADTDVATARSHRLPVFETKATASQLLTPVDFAFPQGAFGTFPGIGPIPSADT
jgi:outer membrane protein TolC